MSADLGEAAHATHKDYIHSFLDPGGSQTRLLTLRKGHKHEELCGYLSTYSLTSTLPRYDAISYCWGDVNSRDHYINLDGSHLPITRNAHAALVNTRVPTQDAILWMDQVCIDQSNLDEKIEHIARMGEIFRYAHRVLIHLGDSIPGLDDFFGFLYVLSLETLISSRPAWHWSKIKRLLQTKPSSLPSDNPLEKMFPVAQLLQPRTLELLQEYENRVDMLLQTHEALLNSPWFLRIWVVQESVLARQLHLVHHGQIVHWDAFIIVTKRMNSNTPSPRYPRSTLQGLRSAFTIDNLRLASLTSPRWWPMVLQKLWSFLGRGHRDISHGSSLSLLVLLRHFRIQKASDDRDKVFGLLGLAPNDVSALLGENYGSANYTSSIAGICIHYAVSHMIHSGTLDVLMATCSSAAVHASLPYWIPDWSQEAPICDSGYALLRYRKQPPHLAAMSRPANPEFLVTKDGSVGVVLAGIEFDVVSDVMNEMVDVGSFWDPRHSIWKIWRDFALQQESSIADIEDALDTEETRRQLLDLYSSFWRVLCYDVDSALERTTRESVSQFLKWSAGLLGNDIMAAQDITGTIIWRGRKIFRTKRGYLGNGCANVLPGDKICLCYGGRFPLLLRADPDTEFVARTSTREDKGKMGKSQLGYKLIGGDCYVDGIAYGEGLEVAREEGMEDREFCLI